MRRVCLGKENICKNCIKADVCKVAEEFDKEPVDGIYIEGCDYFKDRNRFVELPCKVGDTIYILTNDSPTGIEESQVKKIELIKTQSKTKIRLTVPCVYDDWGGAQWEIGVNDFGKTAFLTRKEAERVLKRSVKQSERRNL